MAAVHGAFAVGVRRPGYRGGCPIAGDAGKGTAGPLAPTSQPREARRAAIDGGTGAAGGGGGERRRRTTTATRTDTRTTAEGRRRFRRHEDAERVVLVVAQLRAEVASEKHKQDPLAVENG
ncbi:hypothetical protein DBV15_02701 [Temnothorax longispinosus]|uniref:Uncharacterized protein n=1 Tax=Temnothorax longispinosus TaxID=300112 RepID=A0A4S2KAR9_9HYME|nr:hypothetical protein DBV15_02701 [Temnothorax longispinosus]